MYLTAMIRRSGVLVLTAGLAVVTLGCWEQTKQEESTGSQVDHRAVLAQKRQQALTDHHQRCVKVFGEAPGFGGARMPRPSHNQNYPMDLSLPAGAEILATTPAGQQPPEVLQPWHVEKVELVGLMFSDKPRVYTTAFQGFLIQNQARDLDEFEALGLTRLKDGEPIVLLDTPNEVRMLGPVRAEQKCLKCHQGDEARQVKEGSLLGAFTYVLKPGPAPQPKAAVPPVAPGQATPLP